MLHHVTAVVFGTAAVGDRNTLKRKIQKPRTGRGFRHALDYIRREIKIALILRAVVKPDDRLENRRTRKSRPIPRLPEFAAAAPAGADFADHVIAQPFSCAKRILSLFIIARRFF